MQENSTSLTKEGRASKNASSLNTIVVNDIITGMHIIALIQPNNMPWKTVRRSMLLMAAIFPAIDIEFDSLFIFLCLRQYQRLCCSTKCYAYYSNIALCIINSVCSLNIKNSTFQLTGTLVTKTSYSTIQSQQLRSVSTKSFFLLYRSRRMHFCFRVLINYA